MDKYRCHDAGQPRKKNYDCDEINILKDYFSSEYEFDAREKRIERIKLEKEKANLNSHSAIIDGILPQPNDNEIPAPEELFQDNPGFIQQMKARNMIEYIVEVSETLCDNMKEYLCSLKKIEKNKLLNDILKLRRPEICAEIDKEDLENLNLISIMDFRQEKHIRIKDISDYDVHREALLERIGYFLANPCDVQK